MVTSNAGTGYELGSDSGYDIEPFMEPVVPAQAVQLPAWRIWPAPMGTRPVSITVKVTQS